MHAGLTVIRDEHRTLAAIIDGLVQLVDAIEAGTARADFAVLTAIIDYVEAFPDRLHHPKEDQVLFPAIRRRTSDLDAVIAELERGHQAGPRILAALRTTLQDWRAHPARPGAFPALARDYARHMWDHIDTEETQILAHLGDWLTESDWAVIDKAFTDHADPLVGANKDNDPLVGANKDNDPLVGADKDNAPLIAPGVAADLDALFARILRAMPAPIGLG